MLLLATARHRMSASTYRIANGTNMSANTVVALALSLILSLIIHPFTVAINSRNRIVLSNNNYRNAIGWQEHMEIGAELVRIGRTTKIKRVVILSTIILV
jgi:hypothetical protein